jgi:hypothetical protein
LPPRLSNGIENICAIAVPRQRRLVQYCGGNLNELHLLAIATALDCAVLVNRQAQHGTLLQAELHACGCCRPIHYRSPMSSRKGGQIKRCDSNIRFSA